MKIALSSLFFLLIFTGTNFAATEPFYVSAEKGIYRGEIDPATGMLGPLKLVFSAFEPSYLALSPTQHVLYACFDHTIAAYKERAKGALGLLDENGSGKGTCHLCIDPTGRYLFATNYDNPSLVCFALEPDGAIGRQLSTMPFVGTGPDTTRQEHAHPHSVYVDRKDHHVYVCDLGSDKIWIFKFDADTGALSPATPAFATVDPGSGPRHLAFDVAQKRAYVNGELGANLSIFSREQNGALNHVATISTLSPDRPRSDGATAEIVMHPNGKWLYVSNRVGNTIALFAIGADGSATLIENAPSVAQEVRGFWIDPAGKWLVAGGLHDNRLVVLKIDSANGTLTGANQTAAIEAPNDILFVPATK